MKTICLIVAAFLFFLPSIANAQCANGVCLTRAYRVVRPMRQVSLVVPTTAIALPAPAIMEAAPACATPVAAMRAGPVRRFIRRRGPIRRWLFGR